MRRFSFKEGKIVFVHVYAAAIGLSSFIEEIFSFSNRKLPRLVDPSPTRQ